MRHRHGPATQARGTALVEALISFMVLSVGMLAATRIQTDLRLHAELARQRAEAVRLAQDDLERLRAYVDLAAYGAIADARSTASGDGSGATSYEIERKVDAGARTQATAVVVTVRWTARDSAARSVTLASFIAAADPAAGGALAIAPVAATAVGAYGRSVDIPLAARDLGDGRSALKPVEGGTVAIVFDNVSGAVLARCSGVAATRPTQRLAAADLAGCDSGVGMLLSGSVRYTTAAAPNPAAANDAPLPADVSLTAASEAPSSAQCDGEAKKTVRYTVGSGLRYAAVPVDATPDWLGLPAWADTGDRHVAYHCVVRPPAGGRWSGSAQFVPRGWSVGSGPADRHVCRYSADLDGSGAVDANLEHPYGYTHVGNALAQQNFLVVPGTATCPAAAPVRIDGTAQDVLVDLSTALQQP